MQPFQEKCGYAGVIMEDTVPRIPHRGILRRNGFNEVHTRNIPLAGIMKGLRCAIIIIARIRKLTILGA